MSLEDDIGGSAKYYPYVFDKFRHCNQILACRRDGAVTKKRPIKAADFPVYMVRNGKVLFCVTTRTRNLIFWRKNLKEAMSQLYETGNYRLDVEGIHTILESIDEGYALCVEYSKLNLIPDKDNRFAYLPINTSKYMNNLNPEEGEVALWFYGKTKEELALNMKWLNSEEGVVETRVCLLNADYIRSEVPEGEAIGQICVSNGHPSNYSVFANNSGVVSFLNYLSSLQNSLKTRQPDPLRASLTMVVSDGRATMRVMTDRDYELLVKLVQNYPLHRESS